MTGLVESKQTLPGDQLVACDSPVGRLGVTVCYDIRFPEIYQKLVFLHGARVLLVPSAFAMKTGEAHWETLLRCRAIETQCYVFAAAQVGQHNEDGNKRQSWGHALAIDPWGNILADLGKTPGLAVVEIDSELIQKTRENMPMHLHRRYDLYGDGPHSADDDATKREELDKSERAKAGLFFG
jgi:predicted amidohydrolase